jgi:hypothetical protein
MIPPKKQKAKSIEIPMANTLGILCFIKKFTIGFSSIARISA